MNTQIIANVDANNIQNNQDIYSKILKYLYLRNTKLPTPDKHIIIIPYGDWSKTGHISGEAISYLNFTDNSIIFLSEINDGEDIIIPDKNTSIKIQGFTNSSNESLVDNQILDNIYQKMDNVKIGNSFFENNSHFFSNIPLVIEASRIRKRGVPLCTPIFIGKKTNSQKLGLILKDLVQNNGKSIIINSMSLKYNINDNIRNEYYLDSIISSFLPEISFNLLDDNNVLLLSYLASYFKTPISPIGKGRCTSGEDIFEFKTFGLSKNKTYYDFDIYDINNRKKIWKNIVNSINNNKIINLNYEGCASISINEIHKNNVFYSKTIFEKGQDLGVSIYNAAINILDHAPIEDLENYFIEIKCIINLEHLSQYNLFSKKNQNKYNIIGFSDNNLIYMPVLHSVAKTIQNFSLDINNLYLCEELSISLPINIVLNFCEKNYP